RRPIRSTHHSPSPHSPHPSPSHFPRRYPRRSPRRQSLRRRCTPRQRRKPSTRPTAPSRFACAALQQSRDQDHLHPPPRNHIRAGVNQPHRPLMMGGPIDPTRSLHRTYSNSPNSPSPRNECKHHIISYYLNPLRNFVGCYLEVPLMKRSILVS